MTQPTDIRRARGLRPRLLDVFSCAGGGGKPSIPELQAALGIDWTVVREELTETIPPAFSEHIGRAFLAQAAWEVAA